MKEMPPGHFPLDMFAGVHSVAIIANGVIHDLPLIASLIEDYSSIVAVDGGLIYCDKIGAVPDLIIGDLDSVPSDVLKRYQHVPTEKFSVDKSWTDLDLAVFAVNSPGMRKIAVFGALEGLTAHALNNLLLAHRFPGKLVIETERETITVLKGTNTLSVTPGQTLSLVPIGPPAVNVTTEGLKWELQQATLDKEFMSISNVCLKPEVRIDIGTGELTCCLSRSI